MKPRLFPLLAALFAAPLFAGDLPAYVEKLDVVSKAGLEPVKSVRVGPLDMVLARYKNRYVTFFASPDLNGTVIFGQAVASSGKPIRFLEQDKPPKKSEPVLDKYREMAAYKIGKGERELFLFTDPECPYCRKLENFLPKIAENATVYVFFYPLDSLHPTARRAAAWVMDRNASERARLTHEMAIEGRADYLDANVSAAAMGAVREQEEVGRHVGVSGTPTLLDVYGNDVLSEVFRENNITNADFANAPFARVERHSRREAASVDDASRPLLRPEELRILDARGVTVIMGEGRRDVWLFVDPVRDADYLASEKFREAKRRWRLHVVPAPVSRSASSKYAAAWILSRHPSERPAALAAVAEGKMGRDSEHEVESLVRAEGSGIAERIATALLAVRQAGATTPFMLDAKGRRIGGE